MLAVTRLGSACGVGAQSDLIAGNGARSAIRTERDLARAAYELAEDSRELTVGERALVPTEKACVDVRVLRDAIRSGDDPLGDALCALRSPRSRRRVGAVYTPQTIVETMISWATTNGRPVRVVDPGAGSGRFIGAAARAFPDAALIAVEIDPLAALILRANATVRRFADRLAVVVGDYRGVALPEARGPTLFVGNPPYVRHHGIDPVWKSWLARAAAERGYRASKLAGSHVHFLLKTCLLAKDGDYGTFITSAEWLDVNYGDLVRRLAVRDLGGVSIHTIAAAAMPFGDTATTGAILCFRVGHSGAMRLRALPNVAACKQPTDAPLAGGQSVPRSRLERASRWSPLFCAKATAPQSFIELGELCRVHRGQVTGCNRAWIAGVQAEGLPPDVLKPTVTRARELFAAAPTLSAPHELKRVVDLPGDLSGLCADERRRVERFLMWAKASGADRSYVARHRQQWWSVGLRPAAPILCTYMARRPPAFVRNLCGARHLNIAHGLYPRQPMPERLLDALCLWLHHNVRLEEGRTYAGGLTKFEPKEVERILVPPPEELDERTENLDAAGTRSGRFPLAGGLPSPAS